MRGIATRLLYNMNYLCQANFRMIMGPRAGIKMRSEKIFLLNLGISSGMQISSSKYIE